MYENENFSQGAVDSSHTYENTSFGQQMDGTVSTSQDSAEMCHVYDSVSAVNEYDSIDSSNISHAQSLYTQLNISGTQ